MMNREDPDKIDKYGNKFWYDVQGKNINENNLNQIWHDGFRYWYGRGILHNDFGPAIIWYDGEKSWCVDGKELTKQEFLQHKIKNFINEE